MELSQMKSKLKGMLTPCRYAHSLAVMDTAVELARQYGADIQKARLAGLLHDCAKDLPYESALRLCDRLQVPLSEETRRQPPLIHAELGAELCALEFGVTDPEIRDAIRYHTLGRPAMTLLDKIIYLADYTEPSRKPFAGLDEVRELCGHDLDAAMLAAVNHTIQHIREKGKTLHPQSLKTQQYYAKRVHRPCCV